MYNEVYKNSKVRKFYNQIYDWAKSLPENVIVKKKNEAENLFISVGVFIHWLAEDDKKIQEYNYQATKESIERAVSGEPKAKDVVSQKDSAEHPFAAK